MSESIKQIDFNTFSSVCRYRSIGADYHGSSEFYLTCHKPDCVPRGSSWGICDEHHCPFYGCCGKDAKIYVGDRLVATVKNVNFHLVG